MRYRKGYKIQLAEDELCVLPNEFRGFRIETDFITLIDCVLTGLKGYASDLASGPTIDTENTQVPSVRHDILYELLRLGLLPQDLRVLIDGLFVIWLDERGMSKFRQWYFAKGLKWAKGKHAHPKNKKKIYTVK
tara:strand:- start:1527 stop:1928 length:402 start_codon:yes stop_codon:yes gene_type:complete